MTMTMSNKLEKLISLIREGMEYAEPDEEDGSYLIKIYEDTLFSNGFSREDTERLLNKLRVEGLVELIQTFYAPHTTLSTYEPDSNVKGKTVPDEIFNKPVYYLHINKEKLGPGKSDEPFSFDEETGFLHFHGKECELILKQVEYYVFKTLYAKPIGTRVQEDDIEQAIDLVTTGDESSSRVYDARRRINKRAKELLGIEKLIGYKNSVYWINQP